MDEGHTLGYMFTGKFPFMLHFLSGCYDSTQTGRPDRVLSKGVSTLISMQTNVISWWVQTYKAV